MHDPSADIGSQQTSPCERRVQDQVRVLRGKRRHLRRQDVPQHSIALFEAQGVALHRIQERVGLKPLDAPAARARTARKNRRAGAVAKQAGANQHPGIVIQVEAAEFTQTESTRPALPPASNASAVRKFGTAAPQPCPTRSRRKASERSPSS